MQLNEQTDMFPELARGYRFWGIRAEDPQKGNWVTATMGEGVPNAADIQRELGFEPYTISELSPNQAREYTPAIADAIEGEYLKAKRGKRRA